MKRILMTATLASVLTAGGWVLAQTVTPPKATATVPAPKNATPASAPAAKADPPAGHDHGAPGAEHGTQGAEHGMMGGGHGMMGGGMMGGGMCPMMAGGASTKVEVKKVDKGVTVTLTSTDAATVVRLQKMAEAMRLMHEATTQ